MLSDPIYPCMLDTRHYHLFTFLMNSFKSNENIHKNEDGSYYVVARHMAS